MFIEETQEILEAFKRYVEHFNEIDDYYKIVSIKKDGTPAVGLYICDYSLLAWIDQKLQLNIINPDTKESVFDYAKEHGWDAKTVNYIKYGAYTESEAVAREIAFVNEKFKDSNCLEVQVWQKEVADYFKEKGYDICQSKDDSYWITDESRYLD